MRIFCIFIFILLLLDENLLFSQEIGMSLVQNFTQKNYKAHPQNFAVAQDQRGVIYFGNVDGVLEFDGVHWNLIKIPNDLTVRDLAVDSLGIIYVGSVGNFGFLKSDDKGTLKYHSISDELPKEEKNFRDIWEIIVSHDRVFFRSNQKIFCTQNQKITNVWNTDDAFLNLFFYENQGFVIESTRGVLQIQQDSLIQVPSNFQPSTTRYNRFKSIQKNIGIILGTRSNGLQIFKKSNQSNTVEIQPFPTDADDFLKAEDVYSGVAFDGGFILNTTGSGFVWLDNEGKVIRYFSKENGIKFNTIYDVMIDQQHGLWLATSDGISRVEFQSPITFWNEDKGITGAVTFIKRFDNELFIGTLNGFYKIENNTPIILNNVLGLNFWDAVYWKNSKINAKKIILCASDGIYELIENKLKLIYKKNHCFKIIISKINPNILYIGSGSSLLIGEIKGNEYTLIQEITDVFDIRSIVEEKDGNLWIGTFRNGIMKVDFDEKSFNVKKIQTFGTEHGLPSLRNIQIKYLKNQLLFATERGLYEFNEEQQKFINNSLLGYWHYNFKKDIFTIEEDVQQNLWLSGLNKSHSPIIFAKKINSNYQKSNFEFHFEPFQQIPDMLLLSSYIEDNGVIWFGGNNGLYRYDSKIESKSPRNFTAVIRKLSNSNDSLFLENIKNSNSSILQFSYSTPLKFYFSASNYTDLESNKYKIMLNNEGENNEEWSDWTALSQKEYLNLWEGKYVFKVKSKNIFGHESNIAEYSFEILPPFYRTNTAYFIYILVFTTFFIFIIKLNAIRLEKINKKLQIIIENKTREVREKNIILEQQKEELLTQTETLKTYNEDIIKQSIELKQQAEEIQSQRDNILVQNEVLEKLNENIRVLSNVGQQITATLDMNEMIKKVYENVNRLLKAEGFGIGILNEKLKRIEFSNFIEKGKILQGIFDDLNDKSKLSIKCLLEDKIYIFNDIELDFERVMGRKPQISVGEIPESVIYMPLKIGTKSIGVITVQSFEKNAYSTNDLEMLRSLATYISIALLNAKTFHDLQTQKNELEDARQIITQQNIKLLNINLELEEQVSDRTKELREAYNELDTFLYRSAHDLKGPIARILGLCYVAKMDITDLKSINYLSMLETSTKSMDSLINRLLKIHEVKTYQSNNQSFILKNTVDELINSIKIPTHIELNLNYLVNENLTLNSDKFLFMIIFRRLIENSIQYFDELKQKNSIHIEFRQIIDNQLLISIKDNGIGIPFEITHKIFDMFYIGTYHSNGFGLGLYEASIAAKKMKAKIKLNQSDNQGTEFCFMLPISLS